MATQNSTDQSYRPGVAELNDVVDVKSRHAHAILSALANPSVDNPSVRSSLIDCATAAIEEVMLASEQIEQLARPAEGGANG